VYVVLHGQSSNAPTHIIQWSQLQSPTGLLHLSEDILLLQASWQLELIGFFLFTLNPDNDICVQQSAGGRLIICKRLLYEQMAYDIA